MNKVNLSKGNRVRDLTTGSILGHLVRMAIPMLIGMLVQTAYFLVDLYFVSAVGNHAIAGVALGGNITFMVLAITQVLNVGTNAVVSHATGQKNKVLANHLFNQALLLSLITSALMLAGGYAIASLYLKQLSADHETLIAGHAYLRYYIPALGLQFPMTVIGSALRATGVVKPTTIIQMLTVVLNIILAPVLIAGWGTGHPLGVAGAGLASAVSIFVGFLVVCYFMLRQSNYIKLSREFWHVDRTAWRRVLTIGLPAGGEFFIMFAMTGIAYLAIRPFGATAQAAYGLCARVMQAIFLPCLALSFAAPAIAGQNFGAGYFERVRATFGTLIRVNIVVMVAIFLICQWRPASLISSFTHDPAALAIGGDFFRIISWNFIASGIIFSCSGLFQAMGNTLPSLLASASRIFTYILPVLWLAAHPGSYPLLRLWHISVASAALQALLCYVLLRREFSRRLSSPTAVGVAA